MIFVISDQQPAICFLLHFDYQPLEKNDETAVFYPVFPFIVGILYTLCLIRIKCMFYTNQIYFILLFAYNFRTCEVKKA